MTSAQCASYLQVSESQLAQWRRKGLGPRVRRFSDGNSASARYFVEDVDEWIRSLTTAAPKAPNRKIPERKTRSRKRTASQ